MYTLALMTMTALPALECFWRLGAHRHKQSLSLSVVDLAVTLSELC